MAFASQALSAAENYSITELETWAVIWAIQFFHAYLYGHEVTLMMDHSAVKAILQPSSPNGKYVRWWLMAFTGAVGKVQVVYNPEHENTRANALPRNPVTFTDHDDQAQVSQVTCMDVSQLLRVTPQQASDELQEFGQEQHKDPDLKKVIQFIEMGSLPDEDISQLQKLAARSSPL
ncbi:MAG: hypothetical protein MJE68_13730 [Proteobacteria bacterium]|nr:hypothetical protein [Pseudomonadota bacterium]